MSETLSVLHASVVIRVGLHGRGLSAACAAGIL